MINRLPDHSDCGEEPELDSIIDYLIQNLSFTESEFLNEMTVKDLHTNEKESGGVPNKEHRTKVVDQHSHTHSHDHCDFFSRRDAHSSSAYLEHNTKQLKRKTNDQDFLKLSKKLFNRGSIPSAVNSGGYSSEEEQPESVTLQEIERQTQGLEGILMERYAWKIVRVKSDGACLFRSVAYHIFGDQENHMVVRQSVMDYMIKNREHFLNFVSQDFDQYISRKRLPFTYGNHVEIQAIAELYNRPVEIYQDSDLPLKVNLNHCGSEPLRLSYHSGIHYNAVVDPRNPSIGKGLGMREELQPPLPEADLYREALLQSERDYEDELLFSKALQEEDHFIINKKMEQKAIYESYKETFGHSPESKMSEASSTLTQNMDERAQMEYALAESRKEYLVKICPRNDGASSSSEPRPKPPV